MAIVEMIGPHPQPIRYYVRLVAGAFRTMVDLSMLVIASGLIGLAVAVLIDGLGLVSIGLGLSMGAVLGSAVVIGVVGAFALGIASEGRYGAAASTRAYPALEILIGRVFGGLVVSYTLVWAAGKLIGYVDDFTFPFQVAVEVVRSVGSGGYLLTLVGVPLAWLMRRGLDRLDWGAPVELPSIYVFWVLAALTAFSMPTPAG